MPRKSAISRVSCGWALPENTFRSPSPVDINPSPLSGLLILPVPVDVPRAPNGNPAYSPPSRLPPLRRDGRAFTRFARAPARKLGWGGRIRTFEYGIQSPAPYRLATPHHIGFCTDLDGSGRWKRLV